MGELCACGQPAAVTHLCSVLSPPCRLCGSPDGDWTGHSCPALAESTTDGASR